MRWLKWVAALLVVAVVLFFVMAPGLIDRSSNRVEGSGVWPVSAHARELHATLGIVDFHSDSLLWKRDFDARLDHGHVDLPRLEAGNVALQVLSSVTKTPRDQNYEANGGDTDNITLLAISQLQPVRTWTSLLERSLWHAEKLRRAELASKGRLTIIRTRTELDNLLRERARGTRLTGAMLSVEGAQNLEGRLANVQRLYDAGFRMVGLAHFFDNEVAGSKHGLKKTGLTPFGVQVVRALEDRGMLVDLAHASDQAIADVLRVARRPVVYSHGGVKATCNTNRNLSDDQVRALAANGAVIGIGYWDAAVCKPTPAATAAAIRHVRDLVGISHVGLGSDFDGAVTTGFDTAHLSALTQALLDAGFTDGEIVAVMGGNSIRLLRESLPPK